MSASVPGSTRGKARHPQYAHRILDERRRHVPQAARLDVAGAAVRIDERTVGGSRHGVDGQIAAREVLLERHLRTELDAESAIARRGLALAPRERVLLVSFGMQEHREIASHGPIAEALELLAGAADDHPVALLDGQAEQPVPNSAADQIHLHR
jgi:hypothetical protein